MHCRILVAILSLGISSCGVVYNPQSVNGSFPGFNYTSQDIIPVSLTNIRLINDDGFTARPLPASFGERPPQETPLPFPRAELAALGGRYDDGVEARVLSFLAPATAGGRSFERPDFGEYARIGASTRSGTAARPLGPARPLASAPRPGDAPQLGAYGGADGPPNLAQSEIEGLKTLQRSLQEDDITGDLADFRASLPLVFSQGIGDIDQLDEPEADDYVLQPGDTVRIYERAAFTELAGSISPGIVSNFEDYTLDAEGRIYFGDQISLDAADRTVREINLEVGTLFADLRPDINPRVEIQSFKSQFVTLISQEGSSVLEIKFRSMKLLDALGMMNASPENRTVYLFRGEGAYAVEGDDLLADTARYSVGLMPGDTVYVSDTGSIRARTEFLQLQKLERDIVAGSRQLDLSITRFLAEMDDRRTAEVRWQEDQRLARARYDLSRSQYDLSRNQYDLSVGQYDLSRGQYDLSRSQYDLSVDRYGLSVDQYDLSRSQYDLSVGRYDLAVGQYDLSVSEYDRTSERFDVADRQYNQEIDRYNQSERVRVAGERRDIENRRSDLARQDFLREFDYTVEARNRSSEGRLRRQAAEEQRFLNLLDRNLIPRDSLTLTGELGSQKSVFLPLGRTMTVAEALYNEGNGFDVTVSDPSRVYVFRSYKSGHPAFDTYAIDLTEPQGMVAMQKMQVRPDDVIYMDTQPITDFSRVLSQLLPIRNLGTDLVPDL